MNHAKPVKERLLSLDILRGLDLFLLVFFQPVLGHLGGVINNPILNKILYQFDHEVWVGFRFWDLIMPLFLFMAGVSLPFAMSNVKNEANKAHIYRRIIKRVFLLFVLGMIVQGNLLGLDPLYFRFYSNTLQAIAIGYLVTSLILLNFSLKGQIISSAILLLLYAIPVSIYGDYSPLGNLAMLIDRFILGRFMDGVFWNSDGVWSFSDHYNYTWVLSSLTFAVTVQMGSYAGYIMKKGKDKLKNAKLLFVIGVASIIVGLLWGLQMPIIKQIWTPSMTLYSGGICFIAMAIFYYIIDYKKHTKGLLWLNIYGTNSIIAYVLGQVVDFRSIINSVSYGLEPILLDYYPVWLTFGNFLILFFILRSLYKQGIFIKV